MPKEEKGAGAVIPLREEADAFLAMDTALQLARETGFDKLESNLVATAVSEIAMNAVRYAYEGEAIISLADNHKGVIITIQDKGPGISNIREVMKDGYSSQKTSLGLGMGAARRAMDDFHISSRKGKGTKVIMKKFLPLPAHVVQYGVTTLADAHYIFNGDSYVIKEYEGDKILLGVIDGLGQGEKAYKSANRVREIVENNYSLPFDDIIKKCDKALRGKKEMLGAALSILAIRPGSLQYAGIGDTFINVFSKDKIFLTSQPGIIGNFRLPGIKIINKPFHDREAIIVMCTDGIHNHFSDIDLPIQESARYIADYIVKHYRRKFGDATVLVAKLHNYGV